VAGIRLTNTDPSAAQDEAIGGVVADVLSGADAVKGSADRVATQVAVGLTREGAVETTLLATAPEFRPISQSTSLKLVPTTRGLEVRNYKGEVIGVLTLEGTDKTLARWFGRDPDKAGRKRARSKRSRSPDVVVRRGDGA
jgi:hypothetical protein